MYTIVVAEVSAFLQLFQVVVYIITGAFPNCGSGWKNPALMFIVVFYLVRTQVSQHNYS